MISAVDSFVCVYEGGECTHLVCVECGKRVERGIVNVANHWTECSGKEFYNQILQVALEKGALTMADIIKIKQDDKTNK